MKNPFKTFADVIEHLLKTEEFEVLIAHSTGSTFALWCLHQLQQIVPQIFIFTTHNVLADTLQLGVDRFGLSQKTLNVMLALFEKNVGFKPEDIVTQKFAKTVDFEKIVFIADEEDRVLPYQWTQRVQQVIPNSEMVLFKGTGHFRMLWSEDFVNLLKEKVDGVEVLV
jgi:pimeloyl-ACP methyl ester carboxylesterase